MWGVGQFSFSYHPSIFQAPAFSRSLYFSQQEKTQEKSKTQTEGQADSIPLWKVTRVHTVTIT